MINNPSQPSFVSKGRSLKDKNQAFTLVELIVVITILAILGTIAFISLQGYSRDARDSTRTADLGNMKTSLELYSLKTGNYPKPDNFSTITYSGGAVWYQGIVGDQVTTNLKSLNEKPLDPLTKSPYTYSVTQSKGEYEVLALYEGNVALTSPQPSPLRGEGVAQVPSPLRRGLGGGLFPQANAATTTLTPKVVGNYNGVYVKTPKYIIPTPSIIISEPLLTGILLPLTSTNIRSQVITNGTNIPKNSLTQTQTGKLIGFNLVVFTGSITKSSPDAKKVEAITQIQQAYTGSLALNTQENIAYILNQTSTGQIVALTKITLLKGQLSLTSNTSTNTTPTPPSTPLLGASDINQATCESVNWMWVSSANDVNIGTTKGNGFCISPRFGDWNADSNTGNGGISWNGWGNYIPLYYKGWDASSVGDTGNISTYGQTRRLNSNAGYTCKPLGTSIYDFSGSTDDIVGRMKWLVTTGNTYAQAQAIEWVQGITPLNGHAIPALYIADCIDGVKDLTTTMTYTQNDNLPLDITYAQYNANVTNITSTPALSNATYQNRQKYLTAWTQKSGSHLPSAFSYITSGGAGGGTTNSTSLTGSTRGEYQIACELGLNINVNGTPELSDITQGERIWTSAIGNTNGFYWGRHVRILGGGSCGTQNSDDTGNRYGTNSARFVVRP